MRDDYVLEKLSDVSEPSLVEVERYKRRIHLNMAFYLASMLKSFVIKKTY